MNEYIVSVKFELVTYIHIYTLYLEQHLGWIIWIFRLSFHMFILKPAAPIKLFNLKVFESQINYLKY